VELTVLAFSRVANCRVSAVTKVTDCRFVILVSEQYGAEARTDQDSRSCLISVLKARPISSSCFLPFPAATNQSPESSQAIRNRYRCDRARCFLLNRINVQLSSTPPRYRSRQSTVATRRLRRPSSPRSYLITHEVAVCY
jgi:hypothetical protein